MLLSKEALQSITLNAKFVHKYADQAFFPSEIDNAPQRLGDQPFLNFFVRYHHRDAPERYSWSRVRRVVLLTDAIAAARRSGAPPPCATSTVEWRGKTIWLCFAVESVQAGAADGEAAEELVMLPQLSNTVPEEDEVLAFCVASANRRPEEKYTDGVLGEAPAAVLSDEAPAPATTTAENGEQRAVAEEGETHTATAAAAAAASIDPRVFVPTQRQVELLRDYKKQHFSHHHWVESELEASKALRQRYSNIGVAAAPVRTVAYEQEHRVVARRQQQQQQQRSSQASPLATQMVNVELTQDPLSQNMNSAYDEVGSSSIGNGQAGTDYHTTQTQQSTLSAVPPSSPSAISLNDTPLSPFLPRSILRQQQQYGGVATTAFPTRTAMGESTPSNTLLGGVSSTSSFSQLNVSQTPPPPPGQQQRQQEMEEEEEDEMGVEKSADEANAQHLSQLRATQDSFYRYVSDEKRSHYLNRLANITLRNSETNAQSRRRAIANERRLERKGNLLESRGLWITDDKERAKQAEDYVKASASGPSESNKKEEKGASTSAVAGGGAGDSSDKTRSAEDIFAEKFKAYHAAQKISFADCADELLGETDADVEAILKTAAAAGEGAAAATAAASSSSSPVVARRAVRRALPNRLNTEAASPELVQAQLVHRSTLRMAKRGRDE